MWHQVLKASQLGFKQKPSTSPEDLSTELLSLAAKILQPYHICGLQSGLDVFKTET
jgi:hypothetical protein